MPTTVRREILPRHVFPILPRIPRYAPARLASRAVPSSLSIHFRVARKSNLLSVSFSVRSLSPTHTTGLRSLSTFINCFASFSYVLFLFSFFFQPEYPSCVGRRSTTFYAVCCTTRTKRIPADSCREGVESAGGRRRWIRRCDIESWSCERRQTSSSRVSKQTDCQSRHSRRAIERSAFVRTCEKCH